MQFAPTPMREIWPEIEKLISGGFSLIPVRDRDDQTFRAKQPYTGWKQHQHRRATASELWHMMADRFNTTAVAMICGKISGNVEVIDIDNKNEQGIDALVFSDIKSLFPELWSRLRIHKSPSGGFHIVYRIRGGEVPGNKKLASRESTDEEVAAGMPKVLTFLETRGEGGYVLVPPSMGYTVVKDAQIPELTWEERCALIAICEGYHRIKKIVEVKIPIASDSDYYSVNPFADYNRKPDGETVLTEFGWRIYNSNARFIWFTRPGTIRGGIHAAFLRSSRLYYFFTTNSEFDAERCYQPSTVLAVLKFGGDRKATYRHLVDRGFGAIRPDRERRIVEAAALYKRPLPPNLSPEAQGAYSARLKEFSDRYPYGVFWEADEAEKGLAIRREALYRVSGGLGFRYDSATSSLVQIRDRRIYLANERMYFDTVKDYIREGGDDVFNAYESFLQKSGNFSITRLPLLDESSVLSDTATECFKFYKDIYIRITANGYTEHDYSELGDKVIWGDQVQDRELRVGDGGRYVDFLNKAVEYEKKRAYVESIIGYLSHNYKDETTGYIPILVEQCEDPRHGGGSGKNLFCNLLKLTTTVTGTPGDQVKYDEKFLQSWNGERLFVISDAPADFKYLFLKELSTGNGKIKKLYHNESMVPMRRMPKFVIQTNYSYEVTDGGLMRRVVPLEFTDFFTVNKGVDVYYGIYFPNGWNEEDWAGYDTTIINSIARWLGSGLKINQEQLTEGGWRKQFEHTYGKTIMQLINDKWDDWVKVGEIANDDFKKQLLDWYDEKGIAKNYQPTVFRINKALETYAERFGLIYSADVKRTRNSIQYKCRVFSTGKDDTPF